MRLLLDANLSPKLIPILRAAGLDAEHLSNQGLLTATDADIFDHAAATGWVVVTADSDFSMLLALRSAGRPAVVLLRRVAELRLEVHADLLLANLPLVVVDLDGGAIVSLAPNRLSVRDLPMTIPSSDEPD